MLAADRGSEMSIVNLAEVMAKVAERGGDPEDVERYAIGIGLRIRKFREAHAIEAARLRPLTIHRGPLVRRSCLSYAAMFSERPVLTADQRWSGLDLGVDIQQIR